MVDVKARPLAAAVHIVVKHRQHFAQGTQPVFRSVGPVVYPELVLYAIVAHLHVQSVVCYQQLLFVITASEEPVNLFQGRLVLRDELIIRAMLHIVWGYAGFAALPLAAKDITPLLVPAALRFGHILVVRAERHT